MEAENERVLSEFEQVVRDNLKSHIHQPGRVLYSPLQTLGRSSVYFMGVNPGGGVQGVSIDKWLTQWRSCSTRNESEKAFNEECAYLDEPSGNDGWKTLLKNNVAALFREHELRSTVLCTNLVFMQTKAEHEVNVTQHNHCWPIHEWLIRKTGPAVMVVYGKRPFNFIKNQLETRGSGSPVSVKTWPSGHANWQIRLIEKGKTELGLFSVIGLPHLSRCAIYDGNGTLKREVTEALKAGGFFEALGRV